MKIAKIAALLALVGTPFLAEAAGDSPPMPVMKPKLAEFDLTTTVLRFPTGLQVLVQEDHSHPISTVYKYVGHGFNDDPVGAEETAHFVEHLWFRSVHGDMPPIMFLIQDLGTMFNATTASDRTDYRTTAHVQYLPILLKLESLRMTNFYRGVTEEQIDVEREVIRNEWRRRNEQSQSLLFDYLNEVVYPEGHPYARRSTHETLDKIDLKVLQTYVDTYYQPEDTTITIIGDFETQEMISMILENFDLSLLHPKLTPEFQADEANAEFMAKLLDYRPRPGVELPDGWEVADDKRTDEQKEAVKAFVADASNLRLFLRNPDNPDDPNDISWFLYDKAKDGPLPSRLGPRQEPPALGVTEPVTRQGPVEKKTVLVGWSLPAGYRDDHFNLSMLGQVANNYVASGLHTNFGKDVVANEAGCWSMPQLHATTMMCGVEVNNPKLDPVNVAEKIMDQMSLITDPEQGQMFNMSFSRGQQESLKMHLDSMDLVAAVFGSRAENIGEYAHWTGDPAYYKRAMEQTMKVEGSYIGQLAGKYLKRDRAAVLIVEPLKAADIDTASESSSYGGASEGDAVIQSSDNLELVTAESIASSYAKPDLSKLVDKKLDNGLRLVVLPHGDAPKVQARLIIGGGNAVEPYGIHEFVSRYTRSVAHDPLRIAGTPHYGFSPGFLGLSTAEAWPIGGASDQSFSLGMTAPAGNLDGALWILRQELETAGPYLSGKGSWMKRRYKSLKRGWFESGWHQTQMQRDHLYPGEPRYTPTSWEDIESQEEWGAEQIKTYLADQIHPENATLLIVGNVPAPEAEAIALKQFGGWKAGGNSAKAGRPDLNVPNTPTAESRTVIFDDEKRTQTQTVMACRLNSRGEEDAPAVRVLGGMLGNQVFATLRVKEGLAYSPGGGAWTSDDGSAVLFFSSLAINKGVGRTVEFFRRTVERVESGDIDPNEVKLHQLRINRSGGIGNQSVAQMAGMLGSAIGDDRSWEEVGATGEEIAKVKPEDLTRLVEGCLDHAFVSLEGPKDVITAQLDERGFSYELYDYEKAGEDLLWQYDKKAAKKRAKAKAKEEKKKAEEGEEDGGETADADAGEASDE